ncbi:LPO_1073/Vpar_1526 family protein [Bacteroides uniformis]|nr:LPO_1073/Vpar_1526 family protein [Bacteroides uniformis]
MADKLKQEVAKNALAVQAGRDVNVGMSFTEVERVFTILFENNFPKLQEIAARTAEENVTKFVGKLKEDFVRNSEKIDMSKIAEPDVQYMFNDIMKSNARKGEKANPEILSALVVQRISTDSNDKLSLTCGEAMDIVPKLNTEHISFLTFHQMMYKVFNLAYTKYTEFEEWGQLIMKVSNNIFELSDINIKYLEYLGVLSKDYVVQNRFYKGTLKAYPFLKDVAYNVMDNEFKVNAPTFYNLIKYCENNFLSQIQLTPIGQLIALVNIKKVIPAIDYKVWIN